MSSLSSTIVTLRTPPGRGGIAVIALAGPGVGKILAATFRPLPSHAHGGEETLQLGHLIDSGQTIDEAVVRCGDNLAEVNIHGGPAVARAAMELFARAGAQVSESPEKALLPSDGFPLAHPAWDNPAVGEELLAALPLARSELAVSALSAQWSAGLSRLVRESLAEMATLHNQDCGCHGRGVHVRRSLGEDGCGRADTPRQTALSAAFRAAAGGLEKMRRLLYPAQVVLAGPPNAGKSTLMNALTARSVSIVHRRPGTTRDWVRELALLGGVPVWLTDTAGVWETLDELPAGDAFIDTEAARRARQRAGEADLVFWLSEGGREATPKWCPAGRVIRVATKRDAVPLVSTADISVSAATSEGLDSLKRATLARLGLADFDPAAPMAFTDRQASLLSSAADALLADAPAASFLQALLHG